MSYQDVALVKDGILNKSLITEEITLSEKQINNLSDILYNYNYSKKTKLIIQSHTICGCLHMKHAILFISGNRIIAHIQIDFIETNVETDFPEENIGVFCEGKYDLLKLLFQKVGIQQFDDKVSVEEDIIIESIEENIWKNIGHYTIQKTYTENFILMR